MNKPITVAREEFKSGLIHFINESALPAFMVRDIINELVPQLESNIQKEYDADMANYAAALREQEDQAERESDKNKKKEQKGGKT